MWPFWESGSMGSVGVCWGLLVGPCFLTPELLEEGAVLECISAFVPTPIGTE